MTWRRPGVTSHSLATHHTRSTPAPSGMPTSRCPPGGPADWLAAATRGVGASTQPQGILTAEKQVAHTQSLTVIIDSTAN